MNWNEIAEKEIKIIDYLMENKLDFIEACICVQKMQIGFSFSESVLQVMSMRSNEQK